MHLHRKAADMLAEAGDLFGVHTLQATTLDRLRATARRALNTPTISLRTAMAIAAV